jgi:hypothetical protein
VIKIVFKVILIITLPIWILPVTLFYLFFVTIAELWCDIDGLCEAIASKIRG